MGALEEGVEQEKGRDWEKEMAEGTRVEMMKGGAKSEPGAGGGARCGPRAEQGLEPVSQSPGVVSFTSTMGLTDGDKAT